MSCKYCDIKMRPLDEEVKVLKGENWKGDGFDDDGGYIGQSVDDKFHMIVYYDAGYACTEVPNVKYCPFCGEELKLPAEPLIKDERIRKAVRAWAEANGFIYVWAYGRDRIYLQSFLGDDDAETISFNSNKLGEVLSDGTCYKIGELCGEEEE